VFEFERGETATSPEKSQEVDKKKSPSRSSSPKRKGKSEKHMSLEEKITALKSIPHIAEYGACQGSQISWFAELMAMFQALKILENKVPQKVEIYLDNQSIVQQFLAQTTAKEGQMNKLLKSNGLILWEGIRKLVKRRTRSVTATWVRGHADSPENIIADEIAICMDIMQMNRQSNIEYHH
jgi:ribonuclease HI